VGGEGGGGVGGNGRGGPKTLNGIEYGESLPLGRLQRIMGTLRGGPVGRGGRWSSNQDGWHEEWRA